MIRTWNDGGFEDMRYLFIYLLIYLFFAAGANAQNKIEIGGEELGVRGMFISKSSLMRPVDLRLGINFPEKFIYVPAGVPMLVTEKKIRIGGREWLLAILENGLAVWVRAGRSERISNFFSLDRITRVSEDLVAIPQTNQPIKASIYGEVWLTPSEVYAARLNEADKYEIKIDRDKMEDAFKEVVWAEVPDDFVAIIEPRRVKDLQSISPWLPFDTQAALENLFEAAKGLDTDEVKIAANQLFSRRLISEKACTETITFSIDAGADVSAKLGSIFTGEIGKIGLSVKFHTLMEEGPGVSYTIDRFSRGPRILEVKSDRILKDPNNEADCQDQSPQHQIVITDSIGAIALINSAWASVVGVQKTALDLPAYSCRDEYLRMIRELTTQDGNLSKEIASFFVSIFAPYSGQGDPAACKTK